MRWRRHWSLQIVVAPCFQAAATSSSKALAALLRAARRPKLVACSKAVKSLLHSFLFIYSLASVSELPNALPAPLVEKFRQQVRESPLALPSILEALLASRVCEASEIHADRAIIGLSLHHQAILLNPGSPDGPPSAAYAELLGSDTLQQYAMESLVVAGPSSHLPLSEEEAESELQPFRQFLVDAAEAEQIGEAHLTSLFTHEGLLDPIRTAAGGSFDLESVAASMEVFSAACGHFLSKGRVPGGSPTAHRAAQCSLLAALQQGAVLLRPRVTATDQKQRAVRRARREGFLQVCLGSSFCIYLRNTTDP